MTMLGTFIDIGLVAIVFIAFVVGIAKGFVKQLTGLLSGLVALAGSIALTALIIRSLQGTEFFLSFAATASGWFTQECFTTPVVAAEELSALLDGAGALRILSFMSQSLFEDMQALGCSTLGEVLGFHVASLIADFVIWLVLYLALKFIFKGIKALLMKIVHLPVIKTLDKIFGSIWSVAITYVIVIGLVLTAVEIVMLKFLPDAEIWTTIQDCICQSKLLTLAHNTNIIGSVIAETFQVQLPTLVAAA